MNGPFKKPLEKGRFSKGSPVLYETKGKSDTELDRVVRKIDADMLEKTLKEVPNLIEKAKKIKELFEELKRYGMEAPVEWVVADAPEGDKYQGPTLYAFTDNIEGIRLDEVSRKEKGDVGDLAEKLAEGWVDYLSDKLSSGEYFLTDVISSRQYIYGRHEQNEESKIYLVDTDPFVSNDKTELFFDLIRLSNEILALESTFGLLFSKVRAKLNDLVSQFEKHPEFSRYNFDKVKKILKI